MASNSRSAWQFNRSAQRAAEQSRGDDVASRFIEMMIAMDPHDPNRKSMSRTISADGWKREGFVIDHLDYLSDLDVSEERREFLRTRGGKPREIYEDIAANAAFAVMRSTPYQVWWVEDGKIWLRKKPKDPSDVAWEYNDMLLTFLEEITPEAERQIWRNLKYNPPMTEGCGYRIPSALVRESGIEWFDPDEMELR